MPLFAGSILVILGLNALCFAGVANLYTVATGITPNPGVVYRVARAVFSFERVLAGVVMALGLGIGLDLYLVLAGVPEGGRPSTHLPLTSPTPSSKER